MRGRFITLEGLEGTGKTTQIALLHDWLRTRGLEVIVTREPGGTPLAEQLRALALNGDPQAVTPVCELLLMFAARATHLNALIIPALQSGQWVLCDRFTDASYAYQGAGRGIPEQHIRALETLVQGSLRPDLTLMLDIPVEVGLARARARRGDAPVDRFEGEQLQFFERVRAKFLDIAQREPQRVVLVDANRPRENVCADLQACMARAFPELLSG